MFGKKKKSTRLDALEIEGVDVCDAGANQFSHMRIAKRDEEADEEALTKRVGAFFMELFKRASGKPEGDETGEGAKAAPAPDTDDDDDDDDDDADEVEKKAQTFTQRRGRESVHGELYSINSALVSSICSIFDDGELDEGKRRPMIETSMKQAYTAMLNCLPKWFGDDDGKNAVVEKKGDNGEQPDHDNKPDDPGSTEEVQKGMVDMTFNLENMTPEDRAQYEALAKRYGGTEQGVTTEELKKRDDAISALTKRNEELSEQIKKMADAQLDIELQAVAKKYELLGKKPEELVSTLKVMKNAGDEVYKSFIGTLDDSLAAANQSGLFTEIGKRGNASADPWAAIEAKAAEIKKSMPELTAEQAIDRACAENPNLVHEYEASL